MNYNNTRAYLRYSFQLIYFFKDHVLDKYSGLEIWRIENFCPIPAPKSSHGMFFMGDSYVILKVGVLFPIHCASCMYVRASVSVCVCSIIGCKRGRVHMIIWWVNFGYLILDVWSSSFISSEVEINQSSRSWWGEWFSLDVLWDGLSMCIDVLFNVCANW